MAEFNAAWWWIDRWRKSTAYTDMTLAEQGAYRNLLDELWLRGDVLPDDDRILAKISGAGLEWPQVREAVMARFYRSGGGWRNETHDEIAAESRARREQFRRLGQAGGKARAASAKRDDTGRFSSTAGSTAGFAAGENSSRGTKPPSPSPSPSPDQTPSPPKPPHRAGEIVELWNAVKNGQPGAREPKDRTKLGHLSGFLDECDGDLDLARRSLELVAARYHGTSYGLWNAVRPANRSQYIEAAKAGVTPKQARKAGASSDDDDRRYWWE